MSRERRIHPRTPTHVPARLEAATGAVEGVIENFGRGGVFFATDDLEAPLDEGAAVTLICEAQRNGSPARLEVRGNVLRVERYFDGRTVVRAFAIRFDEPLDDAGLSFGA